MKYELTPIAVTLYTEVFVYKTENCSKTVFLKNVLKQFVECEAFIYSFKFHLKSYIFIL
jgi:hypothetical protein